MYRYFLAIFVGVLTGFHPLLARHADRSAAERDSIPVKKALNPVVISSHKPELNHLKSAMPVQILGEHQLQESGSSNIADVLRYFTGLQIKDYGGTGGLKTIDVRSLGVQHTTVFYDDIPLSNAQNGQVDLSKFSTDNLEEIRLFNGGNTDLFQPAKAYTAGSSLYLQSRKIHFSGDQDFHLRTSLRTGSFGAINPSIRWEKKISKNISGSLSSEFLTSNGRYPFRYTNGVYDTTAIRHNADIQSLRLEGQVEGMLKDSGSWNLQGYIYHSGRGLPGAVVSNHFDNYQRLWNKDEFLQGQFLKSLFPWYRIKLNLKHTAFRTRYLDPFFPNIQGKLDNHYREKLDYISISNLFRVRSFWETAFAIDLEKDKLHADLPYFLFPKRTTALAAISARLHFDRFELQGHLPGTFVKDQTKSGKKNTTAYSPSLSFSWQPQASLPVRVRGFYKNSFRLPTFNDLYYTLLNSNTLKPESAGQFDLGLTYYKVFSRTGVQYLTISADGYHNRVKDKIIAVPGTNLFRWRMSNIGKVDIKGAELHLENQWLIMPALFITFNLSYTYQKAINISPDRYNYKQQIPYTPKNSGSFAASFDRKGLHLDYSFIYTGKRYSQNANIPANLLPAWFTHDLSLGKRWQLKNKTISLNGEINNLLNQHYDVIINYPMPGRSYRFIFSFHL